MKPTMLLLLAGIAVCMLVVMFSPTPMSSPGSHSADHISEATEGNNPNAITELQVSDQVVGEGAEAVAGKRATVHYSGWIYNTSAANNKGGQFDSSEGDSPFHFVIDRGDVIRGWDDGVKGMKVGGKRTLIVPPHLGYGSSAAGAIPPNSTLLFEIELLSVD